MCFTYDRVHKRHFETPLSLFRVFAICSEPSYAVLRGAQTLRRHVSRMKMSRLKISLKMIVVMAVGPFSATPIALRGRPEVVHRVLMLYKRRCR